MRHADEQKGECGTDHVIAVTAATANSHPGQYGNKYAERGGSGSLTHQRIWEAHALACFPGEVAEEPDNPGCQQPGWQQPAENGGNAGAGDPLICIRVASQSQK